MEQTAKTGTYQGKTWNKKYKRLGIKLDIDQNTTTGTDQGKT